ncbi:MAG: hypothetical protein ACFBSE_06175 [Prochloraceae cyanobacterium]
MSYIKKGFMDRLKAAAITTLLLVTYQQASQNNTENVVDNSSNTFISVKTDLLKEHLFVSRR